MRSYSFNDKEFDGNLWQRIYNEIKKNESYFWKFWGTDAPEAMQMTLLHSLSHYDEDKGNLKYYILSLARTIKRVNGNLIFVDFIENTLQTPVDDDSPDARVDTGSIKDFSEDIIDEIYKDSESYGELSCLALSCMDMFLALCESLMKHDSSIKYYSKPFIRTCLKLNKTYKDFNGKCLEIYQKYGSSMRKFLAYDEQINPKVWREVDYSLIEQKRSKRVVFIDSLGNTIIDADRQSYKLKGFFEGKKVVRVKYEDVFDELCDLYDYNNISPVRFTIGDHTIVRTLGGSVTVVDPEPVNIYELFKMEILTNILRDTNGRHINIGSEYIYLLCDKNAVITVPDRTVLGVDLHFDIEEVM